MQLCLLSSLEVHHNSLNLRQSSILLATSEVRYLFSSPLFLCPEEVVSSLVEFMFVI